MDNKNWSPVAQDKCKTRKLIFWVCQVSLSRAGLNNTRAIYLKYSLKFSELRVKSTKSGSKWKPWSFEHIFLFIVLSNFEKKKILHAVKYTLGTNLTTNAASSHFLKMEFMKKTKFNISAAAAAATEFCITKPFGFFCSLNMV